MLTDGKLAYVTFVHQGPLKAKFLATGSIKDAPKVDDDTAAELAIATTDISQGNIHGECSTRAVATATGISHMTV